VKNDYTSNDSKYSILKKQITSIFNIQPYKIENIFWVYNYNKELKIIEEIMIIKKDLGLYYCYWKNDCLFFSKENLKLNEFTSIIDFTDISEILKIFSEKINKFGLIKLVNKIDFNQYVNNVNIKRIRDNLKIKIFMDSGEIIILK
jgi:hypothetical protein